jgi:hypothetical protein
VSNLGKPKTDDKETERWTSELIPKLEYFSSPTDWNDAKTKGKNSGGHLASVTSKEDQDFLTAEHKGFWIGASNLEDFETWRWEDGSLWNYTNWGYKQPSYRGNCAWVTWSNKWEVQDCSRMKTFYCKALVSSLSLKGSNISLELKRNDIAQSKAVIKWKFNPSLESKFHKVPGVSISWNIIHTNMSLPKRDLYKELFLNEQFVKLINSVHESKKDKTFSEIWAIVVREKLHFKKEKEQSTDTCAYHCTNNRLSTLQSAQITQSSVRALGSKASSNPIYLNQLTDKELEEGMKMFVFMMYCPWS